MNPGDEEEKWVVFKSEKSKKKEKRQLRQTEEAIDSVSSEMEVLKARSKAVDGRPLALRFEAEGDARFASAVLSGLEKEGIGYRAQVHHFEEEDHDNALAAKGRLAPFGKNVTQRFGVDVTRKGSNSQSQDAIFIRNLVGTDEETQTESHTSFQKVGGLHRDAMRQRRNSLTGGGELMIGGSGFPFVDHQTGDTDHLGLKEFAPKVGLKHKASHEDTVGVMKDDGRTLTVSGQRKTTYMHRFEPVQVPERGGGGQSGATTGGPGRVGTLSVGGQGSASSAAVSPRFTALTSPARATTIATPTQTPVSASPSPSVAQTHSSVATSPNTSSSNNKPSWASIASSRKK